MESARSNPRLDDRNADRWVKTAVATISCDGFADLDFQRTFEILPGSGATYVEFNCWYPRTLTPTGLASIKDRCDAAGLVPVSIHMTPFYGPGPFQVVGEVSRLLWALAACERLGATVLKFTGANRDAADGRAAMIETLKHIVPAAADRGVNIVLENHFRNVLEFADDYAVIFDTVDSPNLGICLDIGHFVASAVDMAELVDQFPGKIHHIDVKDCARVGAADFVPYGTGIADIPAVLDHCAAAGFSGYQIIESPALGKGDVRANLKAGMALVSPYET